MAEKKSYVVRYEVSYIIEDENEDWAIEAAEEAFEKAGLGDLEFISIHPLESLWRQ